MTSRNGHASLHQDPRLGVHSFICSVTVWGVKAPRVPRAVLGAEDAAGLLCDSPTPDTYHVALGLRWRGSELPELHISTSLLHGASSYLEDEIRTRSRSVTA